MMTCTCIRLYCWHPKGKCDEPPTAMGGVCHTCRFYKEPPKCPTCGRPEEPKAQPAQPAQPDPWDSTDPFSK